jgi:DNA repair protein RadC
LKLLGSGALSDRELLAIVLGSASRGCSVMKLAEELLPSEGGLDGLAGRSLGSLASHRGLGFAGACRITALVEIARRLSRCQLRAGVPITSGAQVWELWRGRLVGERREQVVVLMLDARRRLIAERCVSLGSLMSSIIHPREVFRAAIGVAAAAIVLVHNHPSGDPTPSLEDHQVTTRIFDAGLLVGIRLEDHVIVAREGFRSFREEGWLLEG